MDDARQIEELKRLVAENRRAFERAKQFVEAMRKRAAKEAKSVTIKTAEVPESGYSDE
jgi:hypothetical protein